ncbi:hypothetical protein L6R50_09770 [Myxococcota bacterium]|nr:hypothetical protein [Myxococcota bacterium]
MRTQWIRTSRGKGPNTLPSAFRTIHSPGAVGGTGEAGAPQRGQVPQSAPSPPAGTSQECRQVGQVDVMVK